MLLFLGQIGKTLWRRIQIDVCIVSRSNWEDLGDGEERVWAFPSATMQHIVDTKI